MFAVPDNTITAAPAQPRQGHPVLVARYFALARERWRHLLRYDPDERFAVLVESDAEQEVWLMGWLPGQSAPLHDHGTSYGAFTVVSGALTEAVVRSGGDGSVRPAQTVHTVHAAQSRVFGPGYVHQVSNDGVDPAVSVHVYRAGGRAMRRYRLDPVEGAVRE